MSNPNPFKARLAKKRRRKPGDLDQLKAVLWGALCEAETVLRETSDEERVLRACHTISQASAAYLKLLETGELERRIQAMEQQLFGTNGHRR
jgi:hypothetical protein